MSKVSYLESDREGIGTLDVIHTLYYYLTPPSTRGKTAKQEIKLLGLCLHKQAKAIEKKQKIIQIIQNTAVKKQFVVW